MCRCRSSSAPQGRSGGGWIGHDATCQGRTNTRRSRKAVYSKISGQRSGKKERPQKASSFIFGSAAKCLFPNAILVAWAGVFRFRRCSDVGAMDVRDEAMKLSAYSVSQETAASLGTKHLCAIMFAWNSLGDNCPCRSYDHSRLPSLFVSIRSLNQQLCTGMESLRRVSSRFLRSFSLCIRFRSTCTHFQLILGWSWQQPVSEISLGSLAQPNYHEPFNLNTDETLIWTGSQLWPT